MKKANSICLIIALIFTLKATLLSAQVTPKEYSHTLTPNATCKIVKLEFVDQLKTEYYLYKPAEHEVFALVTFEVTNKSTERIPFNFFDFQLITSTGEMYSPKEIMVKTFDKIQTTIRASKSKKRTIVFDFPKTEKPVYFLYNNKSFPIQYND